MTQYQRITGKVFGGNATATGDNPQIAQFGSALAGTFIGTTDIETIQSLPAWGQGWIEAVTPDTQFPPLPEMTGAMKVLSYLICAIMQQGVSTWDSETIYYTGNYVSQNGNIYVSQIDENQGNNPETDFNSWKIPYDGQWTPTNIVLATFVSLNAGQTLTYSIPDTIPNDGYDYEIIGNLQARGGTNSDNSAISISTAFGQFGGFRAQTGFRPALFCIGIMKSEDRRMIIQSGASWTDITVSIVAYRRLGKNQ